MSHNKVRIAITPGAEDGVGPELFLKSLAEFNHSELLEFFWCGDRASLEVAASHSKISATFCDRDKVKVNNIQLNFFKGLITGSILERQAEFLKISLELAQKRLIDAIVTGPISKSALAFLGDKKYSGQTEYFATNLGVDSKKTFMTFLGGPFILSLLTTHIPLRQVADEITKSGLVAHLDALARLIKKKHAQKIYEPKIVVLGLNPHAGEDGLLGYEEEKIIIPAIAEVKAKGLHIVGPLPADGFFSYFHKLSPAKIPDAVVSMYHDQGLAPYKLLAHGLAVNVTQGLLIPRTSPAHGTAYSLTGKNIACHRSTKNAISMAIELASLNTII
jgi:4-hydroxythreonine-4-phosphate dehydrogenase